MPRLRTIQWNIGGGRICKSGVNPKAYTDDGIESIVELLKREDADVITLQETHEGGDYCQAEIIASGLGYKYWLNQPTDESFFDPSMEIGQSIISKYPIVSSQFSPFKNPRFKKNGGPIHSKNGGLTSCVVELPGGDQIQIRTFHMVPFHYFDIKLNDERACNILREVGTCLTTNAESRAIVQADFNIRAPSLSEDLPELFANGYQEVVQTEPTTPIGDSLDHIVYRGLVMETARVIRDCRTDHFPIVADFTQFPQSL